MCPEERTETDSLNELVSRIERRSSNIVSPSLWLELYEDIRRVMGYSRDGDCYAAKLLSTLLHEAATEARYVELREVCRLLASCSTICVTGGSESLEKWVHSLGSTCECIVAVDGSTSLLLGYGIKPDIVIGDLDGSWQATLEAARTAIVVVHGHGDNIAALRYMVPRLPAVHGTVQCEPTPYTSLVPGFTDGERALGLALLCGVESIHVYGMNVRERVGWWSKPWLNRSVPAWGEKARKLVIAEAVFKAFRVYAERNNIRLVWH
ncbi:6-hydroxymethylpterin diphosphokinase MptE-like protein [Hyperthermus butylicus]|uniref:6-hydroxymethyl-7,8-dihydropterin pyrophosphokinase n=1 Tax=Hyperthermus butylicus (strain DSM 5456 / JCM 9403 / PLM1-5) TaxID=415426 RepID=A2BLD8_HYPBU|nr:6-hydroxymethylpterin diphosphokinase MptE-like protein [Hyperthermus butylicus]ABM80799.1 conserved archaeal protein [Hyperthermus butylicus DSM 5456]